MEVGERLEFDRVLKAETIKGSGGGECDLGITEGLSLSHERKAGRSQAGMQRVRGKRNRNGSHNQMCTQDPKQDLADLRS